MWHVASFDGNDVVFDVDTDDAMDDDKNSRMVKWFELIKQRNELIREESHLMYRFIAFYFSTEVFPCYKVFMHLVGQHREVRF